MLKKSLLFVVCLGTVPALAQNWDMNKVPPQMQEFMAGCYGIYQRVEDKGRLYQNTEILKKLGIHDQIITHPAYADGKEIPLKNLSGEEKDGCKLAIYGVIGQAEMLFTGKQAKYPQPNMHYCLGYYKSVLNRDNLERDYCRDDVCKNRGVATCVEKCVKKVHEFRSFKMGLTDGKMVDYKQLVSCTKVMEKGSKQH